MSWIKRLNGKTLLFVNNTETFIRESQSRVAPGSLHYRGLGRLQNSSRVGVRVRLSFWRLLTY